MLPPATHEVIITFRVHAPFATPQNRVWLLGSLVELGEWIPSRAIETGQVENEWKVWQARVRLPVNVTFQWSWCTLTKDGRLKQWESSQKREDQITTFSGELHTAWGDPALEIFKQNVASAHLITRRRTKRGDVVAVVGSSPSLGAWDPARGVLATEFPPRSGQWSVTVYYDASSLQEWNWVIISEETREVRLAEKHKTRFLYNTHGWIKLDAPWNKDAAVVDWTPKEHCGGGEPDLGTVELLRERRAKLCEIRLWEEMSEKLRVTGGKALRVKPMTATLQLDAPKTLRPPRLIAPPPSQKEVTDLPAGERSESPSATPRIPMSTKLPASVEDGFKPVLMIKPYNIERDGTQNHRTTSETEAHHESFQQPQLRVSPVSIAEPEKKPATYRISTSSRPQPSVPVKQPPTYRLENEKPKPIAVPPERGTSGYLERPPVSPRPVSPRLASPQPPWQQPASHPSAWQQSAMQQSALKQPTSQAQQSASKQPASQQSASKQPAPQQPASHELVETKSPLAPQKLPAKEQAVAAIRRLVSKTEKQDASVSTTNTQGLVTTDSTQAKDASLGRTYDSKVPSRTPGDNLVKEDSKQHSVNVQVALTRCAPLKCATPMPSDTSVSTVTASGSPAAASGCKGDTVDLSKAGYTPYPQSPSEGKDGRRNVVSDPGRPGYSFDPSQYPSSVPEITCPVTDTNEIKYASEIAPIPSASSASSRVSPPVRKKLDRGRDSTQKDDQPSTVGSETSLGSNVGILGVCGLDKPNPSLENLRQLSEQREHARVTDRLKGLKSREERNKTKFEQSKNQEFTAKRSQTEKKDQSTDTSLL